MTAPPVLVSGLKPLRLCRVEDSEVTEFVKRYLESVCAGADIGNIDYKIEAGELLRRHEAPRIQSESVRPNYRESENAEPVEPLHVVIARQRAHCDALTDKIAREMGLRSEDEPSEASGK